MSDRLSKKVPGSRSWRYASRDRGIIAARDAAGSVLPTARGVKQEVGIDFFCRRDGTLLGRFRMSTADGADREPYALELVDGAVPIDASVPGFDSGATTKALLICDRCKLDKQYSASRIREALDALWQPRVRRVVSLEV